jgi:hypothetical protein
MQLRKEDQNARTRPEKGKLPAKACMEMENILAMLCEERSKLDEIIALVEGMLSVTAKPDGGVSRKRY